MKDSLGHAPCISKSKRFGPARKFGATVMFIRVKKDVSADTSNPSEPRLRVFNFVGMMTRSQLAVSVKTPRTPSTSSPTTRRGLVASLVMFYYEDNPYSTHRAAATVNITSTSQATEATIVGLGGSEDLPINPTKNIENVNLRDYHSGSEGEHTTTTEWRAQIKSQDRRLTTQEASIAKLKAMIEQFTLERQGAILLIHNLTAVESARPAAPSQAQGGYLCYVI